MGCDHVGIHRPRVAEGGSSGLERFQLVATPGVRNRRISGSRERIFSCDGIASDLKDSR